MNALDLYKFVTENNLEYNRLEYDSGEVEVLLFVEYYNISDFASLLGAGAFDDSGIECHMKDGYMVFEMNGICDDFGIDIDEVFPKKEYA
ncbi:MAG: hypothetical protein CV087_10755 [Candidatus Brocadia sp. WS118]|nr:MAG: hypothetical protein CV087_10755 [Candidatus Brocadia sp. WS118]